MENVIRLVATDMDGTLLDSHKRIPKDFKPWVVSHPQIRTVIASGRQYYALERDFMDIKDHLTFIAENGSLVFDKGKIVYQNTLSKDHILQTLDLLDMIPAATPVLNGVNSAYIKSTNDPEMLQATMYYERLKQVEDLRATAMKETIVKLAIYFHQEAAEESAHFFTRLPSGLKAVVSGVSWIDVANLSANKGKALIAIQEQNHISYEESMAFGDYFNDVELLEACKYSYVTANAHPAVKKYAHFETSSNDEYGVMKVLRTL